MTPDQLLSWNISKLLYYVRKISLKKKEQDSFGTSLALSFEQEAIWLDLQMLLADKFLLDDFVDPYNISFSVLLNGVLNIDKFKNSLVRMLQRYLITYFGQYS